MRTRRQFGLWSAATLLAPSALAGPGSKKRQRSQEPREPKVGALAELDLRLQLLKDGGDFKSYGLYATNRGKAGLTVFVDKCGLIGGPDGVQAALSGETRGSRKMFEPPIMDIPVGAEILLTHVVLGYYVFWEGSREAPIEGTAVTLRVSNPRLHRSYTLSLDGDANG